MGYPQIADSLFLSSPIGIVFGRIALLQLHGISGLFEI
jgi:hypothetical protein